MISEYINSLRGKTYKLLPIYEEHYDALKSYAKSLSIEMVGATYIFPDLRKEPNYIAILNIVSYMSENELDHSTCRQQVFKCQELIKRIFIEEE